MHVSKPVSVLFASNVLRTNYLSNSSRKTGIDFHARRCSFTRQERTDIHSTVNSFLALSGFLPFASSDIAWGADMGLYDPSNGKEFLVNAAGAGYVMLVTYFLYRVLTKRARRFKEEKLSGKLPPSKILKSIELPSNVESPSSQQKLTVFDGLIGVLQSGAIAAGLFFFTLKVDQVLLSTPLPEQYTAHNIAVTVRTIIRGFCYLFTFIFAMNFLGLSGLTIKLMIDPDSVNEEPLLPFNNDSQSKIPKISIVSDPEEVLQAFEKISKKGNTKDTGENDDRIR